MKIIILILLVLLVMLQYRVWLGEGGIPEVIKLESEISAVDQDVARLQERNKALDAEVLDLKTGLQAIEERARNELGMIRKDEVYYQVIDDKADKANDRAGDDRTENTVQGAAPAETTRDNSAP